MDTAQIIKQNSKIIKINSKEEILSKAVQKEITAKWRRTRRALLLLLPSLVFLAIFTVYPIVKSIISSLFVDNLSVMHPTWNGLGNYRDVIQDPVFRECFTNNLLVAVVTVPLSIALAVTMACYANSIKRGKFMVRLGFIYPTFIPLVAVANIWLFIYTPIYGILGQIDPNLRLLADNKTAIWALMIMLTWKQAGYLMIFYISGLYGIPEDVFEAARIDGASGFRLFKEITWPLLKPTTIYATIIALTSAYKMVDHLYIMTKGGPGNATNMLLFYIYQTGFDYWDNGKASAMTVILVVILLIVVSFKFFISDRKAYYNN